MRRRIIFLLAALLATLFLLVLVLHTSPAKGFVRGRAEQWLRDRARIDAKIGSLDYSLLGLRVEARDVTLAPVDRPDQPFLRASRLAAVLEGVPPSRPWRLRAASAEHLRVTLERDASGRLNLPASKGTGAPPPEAWIVPDTLDVRHLTFTYADRSRTPAGRALEITVPDASWLARRGEHGLEGTFVVDGFATLKVAGRSLSATGFRTLLRWDGRSVAARDVTAMVLPAAPATESVGTDTEPSRIAAASSSSAGALTTLGGNVVIKDVFGQTTVTADANGQLQLDALADWLDVLLDGRGTVNWAATLVGPFDSPTLDATVNGTQLSLRGVNDLTLSSRLRLDKGVLEVRDALLRQGPAEVRATFEVPVGTPGPTRVTAGWRAVPLALVLRQFGRPLPRVRTLLYGELDARWLGSDPRSLDATATSRMQAASTDAGPAITGKALLRANSGRWTLQHEHALDTFRLQGIATGPLPSAVGETIPLSGPVTAATDDVAQALQNLADLGLVSASLSQALTGGTVTFEGRLAGTVQQPAVAGTLAARELRASAAPAPAALEARLRVDSGGLDVIDARLAQGRNHLDLEGRLAFGSSALAGTATVTWSDFETLWNASALPVRWLPQGQVVATTTVAGTLDAPTIDAALSGTLGLGALAPVPVTGRVRATRARVTMSNVQIDAPGGRIVADGHLDLASRSRPFEARATINMDAAERLAPVFAPDAWPLAGTWAVRLAAEGRLDDLASTAVEALVERIHGAVAGLPVALDEPAHLERQGERLAVTRLVLRSTNTVVTLDGSLGPGEPGLTAGADVHLEDLNPWLASVEGNARPAMDGSVLLAAQVLGSLRRPLVDATLSGRDLSFAIGDWPRLASATVDASIRDGVATVRQATGTWQDAVVSANGTVPVRLFEPWLPDAWRGALQSAAGPARFTLAVTGITPMVLQPFVSAETLATVGGRASVRAALEADRLTADRFRGEVVFDTAEFEVAQVPVKQSQPTRFVLADNRLRIDTLQWEGPGTTITGFGGLTWQQGEARLDAAIDAAVDLRMASVFVRPAATGGRADVSVSFAGPVRDPIIEGRVFVSGGEFRNRDPRLAITDVNGTLLLVGDQVRLEAVMGVINGGTLTAQGSGRLNGWSLGTIDLRAEAKDAAIEFPTGLRTEIVADLRVTKKASEESPIIEGTLTALRGAYQEQLNLTARLLARDRTIAPAADRTSAGLLGRIRLNIGLTTLEDISAENNYGRVEAGAALRVGGTVAAPTLAGRVSLRQGGLVFLGGNTYRVESGSIDFREGSRIEPLLDVTARAQVGEFSIQLQVNGPPERIRAELSSQPPLDQSDIVSLLMTGRTVADGGLSTHVLSSQVLGYLSGDLLNVAGRAFGLDSVRLDRGIALDELRFDPTILASETEPESRLTISKNLTRDVEVILSQNLENSRLTWIATWRPRRAIAFRVLSLDNQDRIYEFRQELTFGGSSPAAPSPVPRTGPRVTGVVISGADADRAALLSRLRVKQGSRFDFYRWQDDRDRLLEYFHEAGHYEASVSSRRREVTDAEDRTGVELRYEVRPGPRGQIAVEGLTLSDEVVAAIRTEWTRAVFDDFLAEDVAAIVHRALARAGSLQAQVTTSIDVIRGGPSAHETKILRVRVVPGPMTSERRVEWTGHEAIEASRLDATVARAGLADAIWHDPSALEPVVRDLYTSQGYVAATVTAGTPVFENGSARLPVRIVEGPQARIGTLTFEGVRAIPAEQLASRLALDAGTVVKPSDLERARRVIDRAYLEQGFASARADIQATATPEGIVDVRIDIVEGPQQVLRSVEIVGALHTHPGLVRRALSLDAGTALDPDSLFEARRRLYETGAFRQVDVQTVPATETTTDPDTGVTQQPVTARVTVDEWPLWRLRYGLQVNDLFDPVDGGRDVGPGFSADIARSNVAGRAATLGAAFRYELDRQALRGYLSAPRFFNLPISSTLFAQHEWQQGEGEADLNADITTVSFEQRYRLRRRTQINYGAFYRRTLASYIDSFLGPQEFLVRYSGVFSALSFDRRDDPFNTRRGWFNASSLKYSPGQFGSDLKFVRWLGQQSFYKDIWPGIVVAWNGLLGLGDGFGQEILPDERFFAGGGSSVRGYKDDSLGPRDVFEVNIGGEALLVLNHEVRFPLWNRLSGVAFLDAGNAFAEPSTIVFGDLEVGAGVGLRVATPIGLLRFDFGIPVSRGGGLGAGRLHFSFGQLF